MSDQPAAERRPTQFGFYLLSQMAGAGYARQIDLVKATGISAATVSRLIYSSEYTPDVRTLQRLGDALGVAATELVARRLQVDETEPDGETPDDGGSPFSLHPDAVAARVARLLAADTPLGKNARWSLAAALAGIVDLVDPPTPAAREFRDRETFEMVQATIAAHNERLREWERSQPPLPSRPVPKEPHYRSRDVGSSVDR